MSKVKIRWKVSTGSPGNFGAFSIRSWPTACYTNPGADLCALISCKNEYSSWRVNTGDHGPLTVVMVIYGEKACEHKTLTERFSTLAEAKAGVRLFLENHPDAMPEDAKASSLYAARIT